jgi:hypothetical protein
MPKTPRAKAFDDHEPPLTDGEIDAAKSNGRMAVSFKAKPVLQSADAIQFIAVKFALANGAFETVLLDRMAAAPLASLIQTIEGMQWLTAALKPGPARH